MAYLLLKQVHIACAALSITGFAARGILMLRDSPWLNFRLVRIVPHVVDTVLLASAIALVWQSRQYPFAQSWLTAKVIALVVYVLLGTMALKRARGKPARALAFFLALGTALYIVSVALTRNPSGFLSII
jgi:uncharacterized membrane protein SirB2